MTMGDLVMFCLELSEDYLSTNQASRNWLRSLNSDYSDDYLTRLLIRTGYVEKTNEGKLKLLDLGRDRLRSEFPLTKWQKLPWDGKWRVVMYDIPEISREKRDSLRGWLKRMGFGQWQISVWISPHPLAEAVNKFLKEAELDDVCGIYESKRVSGISDREFAKNVWKLTTLNEKYRKVLASFDPERKTEYLRILVSDPLLPKELLPDDWVWNDLVKGIVGDNAHDRE